MTPDRAEAHDLLLIDYAVADGATNMARDRALMKLVGPGQIALRFYGWEPWCLSLGRNQPTPDQLLGRPRSELEMGVDVVRRPTGGRSVYHGPELTYAFACSDRTAGGPRCVYQRLHRALGSGLRDLGVPLDAEAPTSTPSASTTRHLAPDLASCFRDPAPSELTVGGRKLVGSAQWRHGRILLQHGSILLSDEQRTADLGAVAESGPGATATGGPGAIGLREVLDPPPPTTQLAQSLTVAIADAFAVGGRVAIVSTHELGLADEERYRSASWGWRRSLKEELVI